MAGAFITFEGGEGAGKSTQARRLAQSLRARGQSVTLTREPGGSPLAERVRAALLSEHGRTLGAAEQATLFAAARADHVDTVIGPALAEGHVVISDRFTDSTEAYQGVAGAGPALLAALSVVATRDVVPDLTLILDCPPGVGLERMRSRDALDRFERDDPSVQEQRRATFLAIAEREPHRCVVLDATLAADLLAQQIATIVDERLALAVAG